ncbi:unnamed protein product [Schistosoma curassoni]|uniref:Transposase n=1 Tax=Schistosoma curassoni TaxID=6186 RepID=A0A183JL04_9TREM|nr:unnamed protein product [Schistosoma curassoni]
MDRIFDEFVQKVVDHFHNIQILHKPLRYSYLM